MRHTANVQGYILLMADVHNCCAEKVRSQERQTSSCPLYDRHQQVSHA